MCWPRLVCLVKVDWAGRVDIAATQYRLQVEYRKIHGNKAKLNVLVMALPHPNYVLTVFSGTKTPNTILIFILRGSFWAILRGYFGIADI